MRTVLIIAAGIMVSCTGLVSGAEYKSSDGYSFQYPDGWIAVNKEIQQKAAQEAKARGVRIPAGTDLNSLSCMIVCPQVGSHDFSANINMVVMRGRMSESDMDKANHDMLQQLSKMGFRAFGLRFERQTVAGCKALCTEYDGRIPGLGILVHQKIYMVSAGSKVYTLTCTAAADEFDRHRPSFQMIADTLKVSPGMPGWLTGGIAGGLIGGAVGAVMMIKKKQQKRAAALAATYGEAVGPEPMAPAAGPPPLVHAPPVRRAGGMPPVPAPNSQPSSPQNAPAAVESPNKTVTVVCACGTRLRVAAAMSGQKGRCPQCQGIIDIP